MVDFEQETEKIESWEREQGWETKDPFTHLTDPDLFVGFDDILKKFYRFAALGKNYAVLYGQYGYGKTSIIKKLSHEYRKKYNVVFFEDAPEREYVAEKIKELCSGKLVRALTLKKLDDYDYTSFNKLVHKRTILIFDEAHFLTSDSLHTIRTISNIEVPEKKLTTCLLIGEEGLWQRLQKDTYKAIRSRIYQVINIQPLTEEETIDYIKFRILIAGGKPEVFDKQTYKNIHEKSKGICRDINKFCYNLLVNRYLALNSKRSAE